jgi:hypothetical protein
MRTGSGPFWSARPFQSIRAEAKRLSRGGSLGFGTLRGAGISFGNLQLNSNDGNSKTF